MECVRSVTGVGGGCVKRVCEGVSRWKVSGEYEGCDRNRWRVSECVRSVTGVGGGCVKRVG